MNDLFSVLFSGQYWAVLVTIGIFIFSSWLQKKTKIALLSPILLSAALIIALLLITGTPNADYQAGVKVLSFLLTPATICLGLSLFEQIQALKKNLPAILAGVLAGTVVSLVSILLMSMAFGLSDTLTISLLPKSVTTAIGLALTEEAGGMGAITTTAIILTGNLGVLMGPPLGKLFRIKHPIARGVAYGTASHVIGTTKATEESALTGAVSSLSLAVAGLMTALLFPLVLGLIR